jgi:hypothetical protein
MTFEASPDLSQFTAADFDAELQPLLLDGPNRTADFSRGDIYADHD